MIAYLLNDNVITLDGLRDVDGAYINTGATVQLTTIKDSSGVVVTGQTFPTALAYVAASSGKYRATLQDTLLMVEGRSYTATITVDAGGLQARFDAPFKAMRRTIV